MTSKVPQPYDTLETGRRLRPGWARDGMRKPAMPSCPAPVARTAGASEHHPSEASGESGSRRRVAVGDRPSICFSLSPPHLNLPPTCNVRAAGLVVPGGRVMVDGNGRWEHAHRNKTRARKPDEETKLQKATMRVYGFRRLIGIT
ncbi:uncharacterized protein PG998_009513 [Apiospora kogelbergensis]|uniref:Uncharacterized protein n=1 Tax=Apiospora kogelbergensis TaxID=1337665 RepID=A0AAW0R7U9_9PEZI